MSDSGLVVERTGQDEEEEEQWSHHHHHQFYERLAQDLESQDHEHFLCRRAPRGASHPTVYHPIGYFVSVQQTVILLSEMISNNIMDPLVHPPTATRSVCW